ncbi:MAG: phosphoenolpyruvate carboxylase [Gammaproteobacteria bacterium]|nr:phosphoenolpyruvate carboxylase [Gammaproteobacteria bacterium]
MFSPSFCSLRKSGLQRKLPIVPLFETLDDLENAAWTLERLLAFRGTRTTSTATSR